MKAKYMVRSLLIGAILAVLISFIQLPYYITKPGMAAELAPLVKIEGAYEEEGSLMLTTVRMGQANLFSYAFANFSEYQHIYPINRIRMEGETDEEYTNRQLYLMENSQESAIIVAYKHAGKKVDFKYNGIYVIGTEPNMPADKILKPGDRISKIDDRKFETREQLIEYVGGKAKGDKVTISFMRDKKIKTESIALTTFPNDPKKVGLGVSIVNDREVIPIPNVIIDSEKIGGPSAGLMFSLEIYNQLTEEDITKGYQIAGTGTIDDNGLVGPIGGISQKVVAADNAGAEIFLSPEEDYTEAVLAAKDIKTSMNIVKVSNFTDALNYLKKLPEK